jgi:hypothetical protein
MSGLLAYVADQFSEYSSNLRSQVNYTYHRLTIKDYIQLVIIVGAYGLLRPYLIKLGAKFQAKDHERELDPDEMSSAAATSINSLRGKVHVPEDTDSESEAEGKKETDWGKKARRRQRKMIREILEAEEKKLRELDENESDKDIEEFLVG